MTDIDQTGYEGPNAKKELKKIPPPESREWRVNFENVGHSEEGVVYVSVALDGEVIGMLRLPDNEHVIWIKERIQT